MIRINGVVVDIARGSPDGPPPGERRAFRRQRVLKGGVLKFHRDFCVLECVIRNLSENGAKLAFGGETLSIPGRFDLRVGPDGEWRPALVRWRGVSDLGVAFVES